jgi:cytochrome c peroxidase
VIAMIRASFFFSLITTFFLLNSVVEAADPVPDPARPPSLQSFTVPKPDNLSDFVGNEEKAILLGKALFWEMRVGSDGVTACASCHFNAGADSRSNNQINPNTNAINADGSPNPDLAFDFGPNRKLAATDFPFRELNNLLDRASQPVFHSNDVTSSQGVYAANFVKTTHGKAEDVTRFKPDQNGFRLGRLNLRQVEPRNTPTVINSVFNFRNFFDGRAQNDFNGVNNWGSRDPNAKVLQVNSAGNIAWVRISLNNASLASQAVAPPLSDVEMSASGRTFPDVGRKLLNMRPLAMQQVSKNDSVLGLYSSYPHPGLKIDSYRSLIKAAFKPQWWNSDKRISLKNGQPAIVTNNPRHDENNYSVMEYNFSLFFGLAVQLYEATLVADQTPYDKFMLGDATAITESAVRGVDVFRSQTRGRCINCHEGPALTGAAANRVIASPIRIRDEQAIDRGFNNISVTSIQDDIGLGGLDPFGNPLANVRRATNIPLCANGLPCPIVADGFMKVPGLRNVELTAPYFHNGGYSTLQSVIDFYSRGGDFGELKQLDGSPIAHLNILMNTDTEKADLQAFLLSLTDERVRWQKAPFDHPQLFVPNGHKLENDGSGNAKDKFLEIKAVGKNGATPLRKFME